MMMSETNHKNSDDDDDGDNENLSWFSISKIKRIAFLTGK